LFTVVVGLVSAQNGAKVNIVQSARDTGQKLSPVTPIYFANKNPSVPTLQINSSATFQKMLGFGGAFTEASAYVYSLMSPGIQKQITHAYFSEDGLNYTVCRVHMDSCDFSLASYSEDDEAGDFSLSNFTIAHDQKWLIPFIQDALSVRTHPLKIFLTPWSPPAWMKGNGQMDGSSVPGLIQDPRYFSAWALFYSKFITAYANEGINIWGLTIQNEPEAEVPWESCVYTPEEERDFLKNYLGPQLAKDHPNITIMIYDHNKDHIVTWADTIYSDPEAAQYAHGTAFHWYTGSEFDNVQKTHDLFPDKFLLPTEACNCPGVNLSDWSRGETYGYDIIGDINSWAVGWVDWNLLLDLEGGPNHLDNYCDSNLVGDTDKQQLYFQPTYYFMGQFSKYVIPGSHRIAISTPKQLWATGFLTPTDQVVIVVMNQNDDAVDFALEDQGMYAEYTIPGHAITTFMYSQF